MNSRINLYALLIVLIGGTFLVGGCDKSQDSSDRSVAKIELSDDDVPVAEDFIEEATKEINEENLKAKLDEIEKEVATP